MIKKIRHLKFSSLSLLMSLLILPFHGCATMGEQFIASPFPAGSTIYINPAIQDAYEDNLPVQDKDPRFDKRLRIFFTSELAERGYSFAKAREEADMEMIFRRGESLEKNIVGYTVHYTPVRVQMKEIKSGKPILNNWREISTYTEGMGRMDSKSDMRTFARAVANSLPDRN
jgi:hypothetical protein